MRETPFAIGAKGTFFPSFKQRAWALFQEKGLPTKEEEAFRYLPLTHLYATSPEEQSSSILAGQVSDPRVQLLSLATAQRTYSSFLQSRCQTFLREEKDPFALLSFATSEEGLFLYVPPGVVLEETLSIRLEGSSLFYCYLGKGAKISLSLELKGEFSLAYADCTLDEGASLSMVTKREGARHVDSLRVSLKKEAFFTSTALSKGGECLRESTVVRLLGEGAHAEVKGLDLVSGDKNAHHWVCMEHIAPHTTSRQHFKAVLRGRGKMSAEGKIYVEPIAQKTEAYQLINGLLLDEGTIFYAKPNLEIFADDVKASHGATIGQLSESERFYLQTRGLPKKEAEELLLAGFCDEILAPIGENRYERG